MDFWKNYVAQLVNFYSVLAGRDLFVFALGFRYSIAIIRAQQSHVRTRRNPLRREEGHKASFEGLGLPCCNQAQSQTSN